MRRGTTPTLQITISGLEDIQISKLYLTLKQDGIIIEKTEKDVTTDGNVLSAELTQEDTLAFTANKNVLLQARILSESDTAYATNILSIPAGAILKDGVI